MLLDSNILIYACQPQHASLRRFVEEEAPSVSIVTKVETLGYNRLSKTEKDALEAFFDAAAVRMVTSDVVDWAIRLRQQRRLSLGDSLIAGTALAHGLTLVTHNTEDFAWIDALRTLDPL
jgi:hypothetical protein